MKLRTNVLIGLVLVILLSANVLTAQTGSVATADDYTASEINPAALMYGNAAGIAFEDFFDEDGLEGRYRIFFNWDSFAFVYGKVGSSNNYRLSTSTQLFRNIYLGGDTYWLNSDIKDADYSISALYRPHNLLSLGLNAKNINRKYPGYHTGIGIRPLWGTGYWGDRIILTGDISYTEKRDAERRELSWDKPTIGLETELINGIKISGAYNLESETIGINFSLAMKRSRVGSAVNFDENNDYTGGKYYIFLAKKDHRSLPFPIKRDNLYEYTMRREIVDEKERSRFGPFLMVKNQETMKRTIERIRVLKEDDSIQGIVFKNPQLNTNYANMLELRRELLDFKEKGKKIVVYSDNYGNLHYAFFASIADAIYLNPNGAVNLIGFSIAIPYLSDMLDKLGIDIHDLRSHDFKTGLNIFTESEMTEAEKATYNDLLDDYYQYLTILIEEGRGSKIKSNIDDLIDNGPYLSAHNALEVGLIDKIIYEDELEDELKNLYANPKVTKEFPNEKMNLTWSETPKATIAVIYATGDIVMSKGAPGRRIGGKTTAEQIKKAREDKSVKGIILRVNSGGGSAYASDLIAREVKKCREEGKPLVVSMGGAAASGGYYISAYADKIVAEPTTVTGSIGVTGLIPNFNRLFNKIAIRWSSLKRGEHSDLLALYRPIEEEEVLLLRSYIMESYDQFVNAVAEGRGMSYDQVHQIAQGRVWSGKRAKELGLIDELGGMKEAIEIMKGLVGYKELELKDYSYSFSGFSLNIQRSGVFFKPQSLIKLPEEVELLMEYKEMHDKWENERGLYLMPLFDIKGIE
ncbi:MAG: signal peptide peptidase SppA [Candidatus Cloacimonetes bacterium]|nr:signal peptide peptidase SppA [Candidatus Cloacimonadota bacterium]